MSDELDWNFADNDDAKAEIRAAVEYLLMVLTGGARGGHCAGYPSDHSRRSERTAARSAGR